MIMFPGLIWLVYATLIQPGSVTLGSLLMPPNSPVGVTGIGLLIWLHAKWRHSIRAQ
jgi:hypothetical protein